MGTYRTFPCLGRAAAVEVVTTTYCDSLVLSTQGLLLPLTVLRGSGELLSRVHGQRWRRAESVSFGWFCLGNGCDSALHHGACVPSPAQDAREKAASRQPIRQRDILGKQADALDPADRLALTVRRSLGPANSSTAVRRSPRTKTQSARYDV